MKTYARRLKPGTELKRELQEIVESEKIQGGVLLSCVGSLKKAVLRMAGAKPENESIKDIQGPLEIVSAIGTLSQDGIHIHLSVSDKDGGVYGGHMKEGCVIETTAEIVIGESENHKFHRRPDEETGFKELEEETKD